MSASHFRSTICDNLALIVFLTAYFFLTVLGNLIYLIPGGDIIGRIAIEDFSIANFKTAKSGGYFLLLFLPFIVTPIVAIFTRRFLGQYVNRTVKLFTDFSRLDFIAIEVIVYSYVFFSFWNADAVELLTRGSDVYDAVRSRYDLLDRLGYWPQMSLKSLLVFLACYGFVRAIRSRETFWIVAAAVNFILTTIFLVLLNMKWPLLVFYMALVVSTFAFARKRPYSGTLMMSLVTLLAYTLISIALLRVVPPPSSNPGHLFGRVKSTALTSKTLLAATLLNRMAQPYPYYFDVFTQDGPVCGTLTDRIMRKVNPCQPSNLIYSRMFGDTGFDEFVSRNGTSPQSVHVYGYALNGWPGAMIELILASVVLGLFISVPAMTSNIAATIVVMGALTGYYFSQLPFEGAIIYDHGILWWGLLIVAYTAIKFITRRTDIIHTNT
ncbi:hypothetical protein [Nitrobacter sp.]|uniref:hypothetical protein n=1 Tax=Nitrobacter sp. TaxID=29420 RepID=UPI0029CAB851|nr:hypothetical protein [Nitrobacter sp.]